MQLRTEAIVLSVRTHGEHGAIVRALTPQDGVRAGFVRGGGSRRLRPVLQPANTVLGEWRARTDDQLGSLTVELVHSLAPLHAEPLAAAALDWVTALSAAALPEALPYPRLHAGLSGVIGAVEAAPGARGWAEALVRYELLLLAELGFGLDLASCVVSGASDDLTHVSPKSARAVGREAASGHERRLLALPRFLIDDTPADWTGIRDGLALTGHFLARDVLTDRRVDILAARGRLVDRIARAVA